MKSTAEVLRDSAKHIEQHGWCRGSLEDEHGRVCSLGALYYGVGGRLTSDEKISDSESDLYDKAALALAEVYGQQYGTEYYLPTDAVVSRIWKANDMHVADTHEAAACMEKAAAICEERGI